MEHKKETLATFLIVNFNGLAYLDELLVSIDCQSEARFDTLLLDNGSSDGSPGYVARKYPWVQILKLGANLGFSKAVNIGARKTESPYLALVNTDIKLDEDWLRHLINSASTDPTVAAVASKIRLHENPELLNGVGGCMNRLGYSWDRGMYEKDRGQLNEPSDVLFASAGAALFRRAPFLECGGFDEQFFMYHEDVDLCWRFWILGLRVVTAPKALCFHHFGGSAEEGRGQEWRELMGERHNIRSLIKNYELPRLTKNLFSLLLLRQPLRRKISQLRNLLWNLRLFPDTLRERRKIQSLRRRSDRELRHLVVQSNHVPIQL